MPSVQAPSEGATLKQMDLNSPDWFVQKLDLERRAAFVVPMTRQAYREASFLDDRLATSSGAWIDQAILEQSASAFALKPLHCIFHSGHVGSTLLSRLLADAGHVLPLREPLPLRTLAAAHDTAELTAQDWMRVLHTQVRCWARGYGDTQCVMLKATSSAARIGQHLLDAAPVGKALYLNLKAERYLQTILAGENSAFDLSGHAPERARRLSGLLGASPDALGTQSFGELAAKAWLTERLTQAHLTDAHGARVLSVDFDSFLAQPQQHMAPIVAHFALAPDASFITGIEHHPAFGRYSKAPEHPYSPALRRDLLEQSRRENAADIARGMAWLARLGAQYPAAARVL